MADLTKTENPKFVKIKNTPKALPPSVFSGISVYCFFSKLSFKFAIFTKTHFCKFQRNFNMPLKCEGNGV